MTKSMGLRRRKPDPIRIVWDVGYVSLTMGYVSVIDAADAILVAGFTWQANFPPKGGPYARSAAGYLHRVLMAAAPAIEVDHIDGDGLNNRRSNLRAATRAQNSFNMRRSRANTSGFKGVTYCARDDRWIAQIHIGGRHIFLGRYDSIDEAAAAYAAAALEKFGPFARIA